MKLWSFQTNKAIQELKENGVLIAKWKRYRMSQWIRIYGWMDSEMKKKGIDTKGNAPIWAWHSCRTYQAAPTKEDAQMLLTEGELEAGISLIEFHCPDVFVLLSNYDVWNQIITILFDTETLPKNFPSERLYLVPTENKTTEIYIQATLPFLKRDWVIKITEV